MAWEVLRFVGQSLVTEALFADGEHLVPTLADLRALGVTIALDDFGAGHSTLHQLRGLPVDVLELDRLFTVDIHQQPEDDKLTAAVVGLATSLGKCVLAQGIDTPAQLAHIKALDIELARGLSSPGRSTPPPWLTW